MNESKIPAELAQLQEMLGQMKAKMDEQEAQRQAQQAHLEAPKVELAALKQGQAPNHTQENSRTGAAVPTSSRRRLLKKIMVGAAALAATGTALAATNGEAAAFSGSTSEVGFYGAPDSSVPGLLNLPFGSIGLAGSSSSDFRSRRSISAGVFGTTFFP